MSRSTSGKQRRLFELPHGPDDSIERGYIAGGLKYVAGTDEAGRGPLAGPVVAAAVILTQPCGIEGINDSKKLSHARREDLYELIFQKAVSVGIGIVEPEIIDEINILQASLLAMRQAVESLEPKPEMVLVDGNMSIPMQIDQRTIIKGDAKCLCIAAASIVAKVARDRMMLVLHESFPGYGFDSHKGYPTESHIEAIKRFGPCEAHRRTFKGVKERL